MSIVGVSPILLQAASTAEHVIARVTETIQSSSIYTSVESVQPSAAAQLTKAVWSAAIRDFVIRNRNFWSERAFPRIPALTVSTVNKRYVNFTVIHFGSIRLVVANRWEGR